MRFKVEGHPNDLGDPVQYSGSDVYWSQAMTPTG